MASKRKSSRRGTRQAAATSKRARAPATTRSKSAAPVQAGRTLRTLYPRIEPFASGYLRVSDVHELYYEQCGHPKGKPVLFVHGGPGAGCDVRARCFFDP